MIAVIGYILLGILIGLGLALYALHRLTRDFCAFK